MSSSVTTTCLSPMMTEVHGDVPPELRELRRQIRRPKVRRGPDGIPLAKDRCQHELLQELNTQLPFYPLLCSRPRKRGFMYCWQHL